MQAYMFSVIINITIKYMYIVDWKYKMQTKKFKIKILIKMKLSFLNCEFICFKPIKWHMINSVYTVDFIKKIYSILKE